jgi:hypothetical protein
LGVSGIAHHAQRGGVEQRAVVEVQDEHRRIGRHGVEFGDRRQALFGELVLGEAADHAHPLRRGGAIHLRFSMAIASASEARRPSAAPC